MSIASELQRIINAKDALKNSINAKTDASHQITTENLDDFPSFVNTISGGGYDGQLPNNSVISSLTNEGTNIKISLITDASASGTRVYYKEHGVPTLSDSYIDVPNGNIGIVSNINLNSSYGFRAVSYVVYDSDKKAFNNALTAGCIAFKMTTNNTKAGVILIDLPSEAQGVANVYIDYSPYDGLIYMTVPSVGFYKLDPSASEPSWTLITNSSSYTYDNKFVCHELGVWLNGKACYKSDTDTFKNYGLETQYKPVKRLSNGDILAFWQSSGTARTLKKYDEDSDTFVDVSNGDLLTASNANYIDTDAGIFIGGYYKTSSSSAYALFKYDPQLDDYVFVNNTTKLLGLIDAVALVGGGYLIAQYSYSDATMYYVDTTNKINAVGPTPYYQPFKSKSVPYGVPIQNPNNLNVIYYILGSSTGSPALRKYDISTKTVSVVNSSSQAVRQLIMFNNKIFCFGSSGSTYSVDLSTEAIKTYGLGSTYSYYIHNNKLYALATNAVYEYDEVNDTMKSAATSGKNTQAVQEIFSAGDYIYALSNSSGSASLGGLYRYDTINKVYVGINNTSLSGKLINKQDYSWVVMPNKQYKIDNNTGDYTEINLSCATYPSYKDSKCFEINKHIGNYYGTTSYFESLQVQVDMSYDLTNKKINGLGEELLNFSDITNTYSIVTRSAISDTGNSIYWNRAPYFIDSNKVNAIILYDTVED